MFATGGVQNNYTRERVPADHHVIFVWDEAGGLTHDRLVFERDSIDVKQVFRQIGIRLPSIKPADMEVGYDASMTAEEFAEKIRCQAAGLPSPREYEIVGIVPDVFGFNGEFVAKVAEYYGVNCASVKTAELLGDKAAFGEELGEMEFPVPKERICDAPIDDGREEQILAATEEIGTATIMKPNDGAGSIGCERDDPSLPMELRRYCVSRHLAETVRYQDQFSRPKVSMTLVQERIDGDEIGLQLMINKGFLYAQRNVRK